jgi:hypothetical protein
VREPLEWRSMIKRDLIDEIVKRHPRLSSRDAEIVVNTVFDGMTEALASGLALDLRNLHLEAPAQRDDASYSSRCRASRTRRL